MFNITYNGIVTVTRGDSFIIPVAVNIGTTMNPIIYSLSESDVLYFGLMEPNQPFEHAILKKRLTKNDEVNTGTERNPYPQVYIRFTPQETERLCPGKYFYQIKLQSFKSDKTDDYDVSTIIDKTEFWIME